MCVTIQTNHLTKTYKEVQAVKDVSLTINKGDIYGFIGLNGAGKTTTIRMLLGLIRPTQGSCFIKGKKVCLHNHSIWRDVGYMVETPHSYPELTVEENLEIYRRFRLIKQPDTVSNVMDQLHLTRYARQKANHLSLGNLQRLGIAKALLHSPDVLILDEPMNGLDPAGIVEIRELLQDLALNRGVTILVSSHLLSEVAKMATKIGIIHEGQIIQEMKVRALDQLLRQRLMVDSRDNVAAASILSSAGYATTFHNDGSILTYNNEAIGRPEKVAQLLVNNGRAPTKLVVEEEQLESYFLRVIAEKGERVQ